MYETKKFFKERAAIGSTSLGVIAVAHLIDKKATIGGDGIAGTVEWLGAIGAGWAAFTAALGGTSLWHERQLRRQPPAVPQYNRVNDSRMVLDEYKRLSWMAQGLAQPLSYQLSDREFDYTLRIQSRIMQNDLHEHWVGDKNEERTMAVAEVAWFLDKIAPIDPACKVTPQTEDPGKYWYDFIESQVRHRVFAAKA